MTAAWAQRAPEVAKQYEQLEELPIPTHPMSLRD